MKEKFEFIFNQKIKANADKVKKILAELQANSKRYAF